MNVLVDALYINPTLSLMQVPKHWNIELVIEYSKNKFACELLNGLVHDDAYKVLNDVIYYKDRIFLVPKSNLNKKILEADHDAPLAGHLGFLKTYKKVREWFSWKGLKNILLGHNVRE